MPNDTTHTPTGSESKPIDWIEQFMIEEAAPYQLTQEQLSVSRTGLGSFMWMEDVDFIVRKAVKIAISRRPSGDEHGKIVCHAEGDRCHGCPHYYGKSDACKYAPSGDENKCQFATNESQISSSPSGDEGDWLRELENALSDASRPATDYNSRARVLTFNEARVILRRALSASNPGTLAQYKSDQVIIADLRKWMTHNGFGYREELSPSDSDNNTEGV